MYETVDEVHEICAEIPTFGSAIKALEQRGVKFNRQGKFRYWFKEIHRVLSKPGNQLSLEKLISKALHYTETSMQKTDERFSWASKSLFNLTDRFMGQLKDNALQISYSPICSDRNDYSCCSFACGKVKDFSWSTTAQGTLSLIINRNRIEQSDVFLEQSSYETSSATSLCCVKSSSNDPNMLVTGGKRLTLWDVRQQAPAQASTELLSACSKVNSHYSKSCCLLEKGDLALVMANTGGKLHLFDKRKLSDCFSCFDTKFKDIFSVEMGQKQGHILVQSTKGIVKVFDRETFLPVESGYTGQNCSTVVAGLTLDRDFFVRCSNKLTLYCNIFRLPILDVDLPNGTKVVSTCASSDGKTLFCSSFTQAFLVSLY